MLSTNWLAPSGAADRNTQALQDLAEIALDLPDLPKRIEGYDISHIQGSDAVASQVVFVDGMPAKQHYRHYKIKNPEVRAGTPTTLPAWQR
jgi:excinuclease ABC subunit C